MISFDEIKKLAIETLETEAAALLRLTDFIDNSFAETVKTVHESNGRLVVTGIGKSAIVGKKIVATLVSTGTPAIFMHAADAIHGDLGTIQKNDIALCISHSGNTPEIKLLVNLIKQMNTLIIGLTGNKDSFLAKEAHHVLSCYVEKEACPNNLAPTCSTTAQMAMGDALAVALLSCKDFDSDDFAKYHPGGALGKRLYLTMGEMSKANSRPSVQINADVKSVILEISKERLGAVAVLDGEQLVGIVTDGDLRRMLERSTDLSDLRAVDIMSKHPTTISATILAIEGIEVLKSKNIGQIIITNQGKYEGFVHFHDFLIEGII